MSLSGPQPPCQEDIGPLREEKRRLRKEIFKYAKKQKKHLNILIFGKGGVGKSSIVNTIIRVLCGEYLPKAKVGEGTAGSKTLNLMWYESCGVEEDDISEDTEDAQQVKELLGVLPGIFDCTALSDPLTETMAEILDLIIGGFIKPGTKLTALEKLQEDYGVGCLRGLHTKSHEEWKVSKVVFVQSCQEHVPMELIRGLNEIINKPKELATDDISVYCLLSKYDLVQTDKVSEEDYQKVKDDLVNAWSIGGATKYTLRNWRNFCDDVGYNNPIIENDALDFLKLMLLPGAKSQEGFEAPGFFQKLHLNWYRFMTTKRQIGLNISPAMLLIAVLLVVAMAVYLLMSKGFQVDISMPRSSKQ